MFYIWRFRVIWSPFVMFRFSTLGWLQIGRLAVDLYGGRGIAYSWGGRVRRIV